MRLFCLQEDMKVHFPYLPLGECSVFYGGDVLGGNSPVAGHRQVCAWDPQTQQSVASVQLLSTIPLNPCSIPLDCATGVENLQSSPETVKGAGQRMRCIPALVQTCLLCSKGAGNAAQVLAGKQQLCRGCALLGVVTQHLSPTLSQDEGCQPSQPWEMPHSI